jgi:ribose 1,5-bisphosphokinase PhnN
VREDPASLPADYQPLVGEANGVPYANPVQLDATVAGAAVLFVNVPASVAMAQGTPVAEAGGVAELAVAALHCAETPAAEALGSYFATGQPPIGCAPAVGVAIDIEEEGDALPGSPFATDTAGGLRVPVGAGSSIVVTEDPESLPAGYVPLSREANGVPYANPVRIDAVAAGAAVIFVNVPAALAQATPVAEVADLVVVALHCAEAPEAESLTAFFAVGELPPGCAPAAGVAVNIEADGVGLPNSPFTTDTAGGLVVPVGLGSSLEVREDPASLPPGYEPLAQEANGVPYANPVQLDEAVAGAAVLFVNVPAAPAAAPTSSAETVTPEATATPVPTTPAPEPTPDRTGCDPAYPDERTCIPPGPPLDPPCSITDERSFTVLPPDPRGLDADGNGIGCEPITP